jgi:hypothetical protein
MESVVDWTILTGNRGLWTNIRTPLEYPANRKPLEIRGLTIDKSFGKSCNSLSVASLAYSMSVGAFPYQGRHNVGAALRSQGWPLWPERRLSRPWGGT